MLYDLESHAKDGRCGLSRNEDIRRFVGKYKEKQTLVEKKHTKLIYLMPWLYQYPPLHFHRSYKNIR